MTTSQNKPQRPQEAVEATAIAGPEEAVCAAPSEAPRGLQNFLAQVEGVEDFDAADRLLEEALPHVRREGQRRHLAAALADQLGTSVSVLTEYIRDHKNTVAGTYIADAAEAADAVVRDLEERTEHAVIVGSLLYAYLGAKAGEDEAAAHYIALGPDEVEAYVRDLLDGTDRARTRGQRLEIIDRVRSRIGLLDFFNDAAAGLNMGNGFLLLDPVTGELRLEPHNKAFKARSQLEVAHDPDAVPEVFLAALDRLLGDPNKIAALQEAAGAILFRLRAPEDAARWLFLLAGPPNTGKSTFIDVVTRLVPEEAICHVPPEDWGKEYHRAGLEGMQLNIVTELGGGRKIDGDILKRVVTGEPILARHPRGRPFSFKPEAAHLFATNELPRVTDRSGGFGRRPLVITFDRSLTPDEIDSDFRAKIEEELPGIVNWAAEGAARLLEQGRFTIPPGHDDAVMTMQFGRDAVEWFARRGVERAEGHWLSSEDLRDALFAFADAHGLETGLRTATSHSKRLLTRLSELYGYGDEKKKIEGMWYRAGLRIKGDTED